MKTLSWLDYDATTVEHTAGFIAHLNEAFLKTSFVLGIRRDNNELIGTVGFNSIDWDAKEAVVGYWLDEEMQGKGIVTESCRVLVGLGFNDLQLNKINISCGTTNLKSQAIPKRLGFEEEKIVKDAEWLYDHYVDFVVFSKFNK